MTSKAARGPVYLHKCIYTMSLTQRIVGDDSSQRYVLSYMVASKDHVLVKCGDDRHKDFPLLVRAVGGRSSVG